MITRNLRRSVEQIYKLTHNSGSATILNGTTVATVNHGLSATPTRVIVTPVTGWGSATSFWVNNYTVTNFQIQCNVNPGANFVFDWHAQIGEG